MTTFAVERFGIAWLVTELEKAGIRVAFPERDTGVDLIAFEDDQSFRAVPIQVKAFSGEGFYTNRKYLKKAGLKIVYLWNVKRLDGVTAFCLQYHIAEKIVDDQERSRKDGIYYTKVTARIQEALQLYQVKDWRNSLFDE